VTISVLSLFAGCGGLDSGFSGRGFRVIEAHDLDPRAVEVYNANSRSAACRISDLSKAPRLPRADVLVAGPPCQGFSTIGRLEKDDQRNSLFFAACEAVLTVRPKLLIIENVMGLRSARNRSVFDAAMSALSEWGYFVEILQINASEHGVAQRRKRLIVIARRGRRPFNATLQKKQEKTVRDSLFNLDLSDLHTPPILKEGSKARRIAERIGPGQKLCNVRESNASVHTWDIPEVFGYVTERERHILQTLLRLRRTERKRKFGDADPVSIERLTQEVGEGKVGLLVARLVRKGYLRPVGSDFDLTHTFNGSYRRLSWDSQSPTVDTHFGEHRLFLHPKEHRGISVREAAALQGFSKTFIWPENSKTAFRLIGNAVPPPVSASLARFVRGIL